LGAWYSYNTDRIGQGRENARDFLRANSRIADEVETQLRAKLSVKPVVGDGAASSEIAEVDGPPNLPAPKRRN